MSKPRVLVTVWDARLRRQLFAPETIAAMESQWNVTWAPLGEPYTRDSLLRDIREADAVFTGWGSPKLDREALESAPRLRFVGHIAGTVHAIANDDFFDYPIALVNANDQLSRSVAEFNLLCCLMAAWDIPAVQRVMAGGGWIDNADVTPPGLYGLAVGSIGYGAICREFLRLIRPFDCRVRVFSRHLTPEQAASAGAEVCGLDDVIAHSRLLLLHNTLTPQTYRMIGARELALMPDGAVLINTARGGIVDEEALIAEMRTGRISAVLDVYEQEPLGADHPFRHLPNVLPFPHFAGHSAYWRGRMGADMAAAYERFLQGAPVSSVTREKFHQMTPR